MEIKKHYKLYKDGKNWCAMALAVAAVSAGLVLGNTNVKADTPTDNVPVVKTTNPTTGDANAELASQEKAAHKVFQKCAHLLSQHDNLYRHQRCKGGQHLPYLLTSLH